MKDLVKANPKYASVFLSAQGKPVIPGSSIKGAVLAWAKAKKLDQTLISEVFGEQAHGGLVTF